jgi:hypothetical protein
VIPGVAQDCTIKLQSLTLIFNRPTLDNTSAANMLRCFYADGIKIIGIIAK